MTDTFDRLTAALADRYRIERELGGGGMSRVFTATERALGRTVVVKVIAPELAEGVSAERFAREIQLAASLQQANIVPLLTAGDAGGVPYYTMPFVQGESLRGRLASGPPPSISESIGILKDVARALSYAHAHGVVHRDIKPDNVLLSHGAAVVTDFGIAKAVSAARAAENPATLTRTGTSIGTPAYMAPEQIAGDPTVDLRADLYAWGCLAYELFAGAPPFAHVAPQRVLAAHLSEAPQPLSARRPDVPASVDALVMRCLAKEPAERPASADELLRDLDAAWTPVAVSSPRPAARSAGRRVSRWMLASGVFAIATFAAIAIARSRGGSGASSTGAALDRSVAVLPLANLSGDKADDFFGTGLSEEITRALSKQGVRVIGRVSAGALQAHGLDDRAIAKQLGVGSLLTGSVQRADGQVRINLSLIAANTGDIRWTEKYDRPLTNVFALQDEIARVVATKLLGSLGAKVAAARTETATPEVYAMFLQGQVLFNRRTSQSLHQAIRLLEDVTKKDPKFARAQALLAMSYAILPNYDFTKAQESFDRALDVAGHAIAVDSTVAESYTAMAWVHAIRGESKLGDALFRRSLALDSTVATTWGWYGLFALWKGDFPLATTRIAKAQELEPVSWVLRAFETQLLMAQRREAEAFALTERTIALDSTFALIFNSRSDALIALGRTAEAVTMLEKRVLATNATPYGETTQQLAYAYARAGKLAESRAVLDKMRAATGGSLPSTGLLAATLDVLGEHESAVALLDAAIKANDPWVNNYVHSERFDRLKKDPRAAALLARISSW